ncbi:uncharacterized protein LOC143222034 [Tachypleus tridentatus]|uniref:uncharacterized protein LOC143222034 n=1 Tax=Tachypleus tridentatus TaxID=6853 RepID=UPI003FD62D32
MRSVMTDQGLFDGDLVGLATDGANVMVGIKTGVATKFKDECPWIITSHCLAHRLQLAAEKAANQVPYLVKYISVLNQFVKSLKKYFPKLCRVLEENKSFVEEVVTKLQVAFPDTNIMSFFSIFSPCHSRAVSDENDLKKLIQHFSSFVNEDEALTEWLLLRNIMEQDAHKNRNMKSFYKENIHQTRQTFTNLSQLAAIGLIIPVISVDCERGIRRYNRIKTDARNSLSVAKTEMLLNLSMKSKPLDHFNFDSAFRYWVTHKDRRGYHSLLKKCASKSQVSTSTTFSVENDLAKELPLDLSTYQSCYRILVLSHFFVSVLF